MNCEDNKAKMLILILSFIVSEGACLMCLYHISSDSLEEVVS